MREILFRGKRKDNGEWVEGFYVHLPRGRYQKDEHLIQTVKENGNIGQLYRVIPETVGQYTGLTDKNGKMIFEGDIHKFHNRLYVIKFGTFFDDEYQSDMYGWYMEDVSDETNRYTFDGNESEYTHIIGTIHDNPELLKGDVVDDKV